MRSATLLAVVLTMVTLLSPSPVCVGEQPVKDQPKQPLPPRVSIMGPTRSGGQPQRSTPPSLDQVLAAIKDEPAYDKTAKWAETQNGNLRVVKELIADYVDPPRYYHPLGPAQIHHALYRVSLRSEDDDRARVVMIDHKHFHMIAFARLTIRAGTPPFDAVVVDESLHHLIEDWNHSIQLFGLVDVDRIGDQVVVMANQVDVILHQSKAIHFLAKGEKLTVCLSPHGAFTGTFEGDVELHHRGESLRCDSLTFTNDGKVGASGNVQLIGTKTKEDGQLRFGRKLLLVRTETVLHRLPGGRSPIVNFFAEKVELDLNEDTVTVQPMQSQSEK